MLRDPIHGDIALPPLHSAVVDTEYFQRLRYIRQNGLLHFIFPGAVHTRFAHSVGTMEVARRVFSSLIMPLVDPPSDSIEYIRSVFELAALLHDVGHCAFSHSIEGIKNRDGRPFLGTLRETFSRWGEEDLLDQYKATYPDAEDREITHEQIGLAFIKKIFSNPDIDSLCAKMLGCSGENVGRDVRAVLDSGLSASSVFKTHAEALYDAINRARSSGAIHGIGRVVHRSRIHSDLLLVLHDCVSGTLDVDRLDYLVRDSFHCGVPYGNCDVARLTQSLELVIVNGRLELALREKAIHAFDDMLWSRYQLFLQVYNHKTNIALNYMLGLAIPEAVASSTVYGLKCPETIEDFLAFTDDKVMAAVLTACLHGDEKRKFYAKTLVNREIPLHLGFDIMKSGDGDERQKLIADKARELGWNTDDFFTADAKSDLVKGTAFPHLLRRDKLDSKKTLLQLSEQSTIMASDTIPRRYRLLHFYSSREHRV